MSSIPGVKIGHGFIVRFGVGATPVFTTVDGWQDITFPDQQRADVDVTHNQSPNETEENIVGLKTAVDWQSQLLYVQGDARDTLIKGLYNSREDFIFGITPPDGTEVQWLAQVKGYAPGLPVKGAQMATVTLKIMGEISPIVEGESSGGGEGGGT